MKCTLVYPIDVFITDNPHAISFQEMKAVIRGKALGSKFVGIDRNEKIYCMKEIVE